MYIEDIKKYEVSNTLHCYSNDFDYEKIIAYNKQQRERLDAELEEARRKTDEAYQKLVAQIAKNASKGNTACAHLLTELNQLARRYARRYNEELITETIESDDEDDEDDESSES
jgi:hypothetical protein